jgi:hypothetical protein
MSVCIQHLPLKKKTVSHNEKKIILTKCIFYGRPFLHILLLTAWSAVGINTYLQHTALKDNIADLFVNSKNIYLFYEIKGQLAVFLGHCYY